ncbi:esterase/lipase family protein [Streptomyces sp. NPDC003035]|uniref:esterase/lipase family protein n=1 Tax=Streptomyces sp. NPDC003035 TaxID=3364676 RepID=UPI0036A93C7E
MTATVAAAGALLAVQASGPAQASNGSLFVSGSNPILFVHGYNGDGSNWNTMADRFRADGWPTSHLRQWTYDSRQSNTVTAQQLAAEVDRLLTATGAAKVDIVSHSMGGLSSRYYLKNLEGTAKVDAWVSLGGPNHGTDSANSCFDTSCAEMRIGSSFLTGLNSGDETPGSTRYATWWSPCDTVINPDSSVSLSGAVNSRTTCLSHTALLTDTTVYAQTRDMINR